MTKQLHKILVANRGEIARRVIRTAHSMGILTVAVYSDPDGAAVFVRDADQAVGLVGSTSADTYLRVDKILDAAAATGADAVHPGYGFLAENAGFASAVLRAGLTWIGPPPQAIALMGDKLTALDTVQQAGVPTLPRADVSGLTGTELADAAASIGDPVVVKP
ncbi:MAG: biotin carboxylase N-terminal domain-containing protein, partial [Acidimicrobiia bacterium]